MLALLPLVALLAACGDATFTQPSSTAPPTATTAPTPAPASTPVPATAPQAAASPPASPVASPRAASPVASPAVAGPRQTLAGRQNVEQVAYSPDRKVLATGAADKTARLWDVATGTELGSAIAAADTRSAVGLVRPASRGARSRFRQLCLLVRQDNGIGRGHLVVCGR